MLPLVFFVERMVFIRIWLITSFLLFRVWFEVYIEDEILKNWGKFFSVKEN